MNGIELIENERKRQIEEEGYDKEHDKKLKAGELAMAGACYALPEYERMYVDDFDELWPFENKYWKPSPKDRIKELSKAGALIAAEIDRLLNDVTVIVGQNER